MGYFLFLVLAFLVLLVLLLEVGVLIGGMGQGKLRCGNGSSVHNGGSDNGDSCVVGECDGQELDGCGYRLDNETAVIALKLIKHDLKHMLSDTEHRSINYAIESIEIRNKVEQWIERQEQKYNV